MENAQPASAPLPAIRTQGLTKHYGSVHALNQLDLEVQTGEIFGSGPNGAGKSTAIRTLLGYLHPTAGSATVLGRDIVADSVEIRRHVGYLPGGISLYDSLSGEDALDYLNDLQGRPPVRREALCERLQMPASVLRRKVRDYSRGMRQKLGVIQAQHDPDLAVLDEPTEGLDPLMQQAFYGIMDDLRPTAAPSSSPATCCRRWSASATAWPSSAPEPDGAAARGRAAGAAQAHHPPALARGRARPERRAGHRRHQGRRRPAPPPCWARWRRSSARSRRRCWST